jgi:hypothetical protein
MVNPVATTPEEKQPVWPAKIQSEHPSDRVSVLAYDFTDDEGRARCTAVVTQHLTVK